MKWIQVLAPMVAGLSLAVDASDFFKRQALAAPTQIAPDVTNTLADVRYLDYGILLHNNQDTGCAMVRLTTTSGVVAAHCFEWDDSGSTNVQAYQIALMGANNGPLGAQSVSKVTRNPYYNPDNYANNLAIVEFNYASPDGSSYSGIIADYPDSWKNNYLVKYSLNNNNPMSPNTPETVQYIATETADCQKASQLFSDESENYICNFPNVASPQNAGCSTGYSLIAGAIQDNLAWGAIYSYSTGDASNVLCGSQLPMLSYYTILRNYVPWFNQVLGNNFRAMPVTDAGYTAPQASDEPTNPRTNVNSGSDNYISRDGNTNKALSETEYNNRPDAYKNVDQNAKANSVSVAAASSEVAATSVVVSTSVELVSSTVVVTDSTLLSAETTQTTTETDTTTTVQTSTELTTSTELATSTEVVTSTAMTTATVTSTEVVTGTVDGAANGNNGGGNSIGIVVNGGSDQTVTVTSTFTQTVSAIQTVTETSLMTVTASVIISESVIPGGGTSIVIGATTVAPAVAETVTVTDVSTSVVTSIFTVTAIPTGNYGVTMTATEGPVSTTTVTETVASYIQGVATGSAITSSSDESSQEISDDDSSSTGVYSLGANENISSTAQPEEKKKLSPGIIAAIVVLAVLAAAILFYLWRKRKNQGDGYMNDENGLSRVRRWLFERQTNRYMDDNPPDYMTQVH